ncbi:DUF4407 domain-containing protein [Lunatibacter salilacus]|uniref:DUF4407 domain-containing protein n=1 Tax=Lunatibacter salilacus TaxID=2483804 RepID=UPI00131AB5E3|nr:DUF4407 domain-containing protein [Lunatibacter salilacus]
MTYIQRMLWFCAGAYQPLLKKCPTESNKYIGIGGTVLFTAIFAGLAAGYAMHTVFDSPYVAVILAVIWALMIFNLDRYIVGTMRKRKSSFEEWRIALPRFFLAAVLALVIAKPLELRIFEKEINRQLDKDRLAVIQETKEQIDLGFPEKTEILNGIQSLQEDTDNKREFRDEKQKEYDAERFGLKTPGTSGVVGLGTNARKKEEQLNLAEQDYRESEARNLERAVAYEEDLKVIEAAKEAEWQRQEISMDNYDGLAARLQALGTLTAENISMYWANIFIILLFLIVETAPLLVKLMASAGPYDMLLDKHEAGIILYADEQWHKTASDSQVRLHVFDELTPDKTKVTLEEQREKLYRNTAHNPQMAPE